jgi:hypothetical protein
MQVGYLAPRPEWLAGGVMSESEPGEIRSIALETAFDIEQAAPDVFAALCKSSEYVAPALSRLRSGVPLMASAAPGIQGQFYRLKGHNRSVCWALAPDRVRSEVIVLKGTEPLLSDFERYLDWMKMRQFGRAARPILEHFPLFEGKIPGAVFLDEARREATIAVEVQTKHLKHYNELMRIPVPLLVFRLPDERTARVISLVRERMSQPAFERVEPHLKRGIGILTYYYPGPPVRIHAVGRPDFFLAGQERLFSPQHVIETATPGWITIAARLLWLGFLPSTPLSWRLGNIFDVNNACWDGGACDVGSIYPIDKVHHDGFLARSVIGIFVALRGVLAAAFGPLAETAQDEGREVIGLYLGEFVKRAIERALATEANPSLTLDPRIRAMLGEKSLSELLMMLQVLKSDLQSADYSDRS